MTYKRNINTRNKRNQSKINRNKRNQKNLRQRGGGINKISKTKTAEIYGRMSCPYTSGAVELLNKKNIKHTFYDLTKEDNAKKLSSLKKSNIVSNNWNTVPVIMINNGFVGGMTDLQTKLDSELDSESES